MRMNILDTGTRKDTPQDDRGEKGKTCNELNFIFYSPDCDETSGVCSFLLTVGSLLMVMVTLPFSLFYTVKVVQVPNTVSAKTVNIYDPQFVLYRI